MFAPVCLWHFIWGWVSLQPSEKEAFRNGRAQEIQKLNEELAASQEKLQAALVAAEKASRAKTTFFIDCACLFSKHNTDSVSNIAKTQH